MDLINLHFLRSLRWMKHGRLERSTRQLDLLLTRAKIARYSFFIECAGECEELFPKANWICRNMNQMLSKSSLHTQIKFSLSNWWIHSTCAWAEYALRALLPLTNYFQLNLMKEKRRARWERAHYFPSSNAFTARDEVCSKRINSLCLLDQINFCENRHSAAISALRILNWMRWEKGAQFISSSNA